MSAPMTVPLLPRSPGRRAMLLATLLLVMPFAVAFGLYWFEWRPTRTGNHGELIQPPRPLPENGLRETDGRPLPTAELRGKWLLVLAGDGPCDAACAQQLHLMRQIQVAQNKEMGRLRRVWLGAGAARDPALPELRRQYPDLVVAVPPEGAAANDWRGALDGSSYRLYLVDPLGNAMMRYAPDADPTHVRKDLERLLKYSWVG